MTAMQGHTYRIINNYRFIYAGSKREAIRDDVPELSLIDGDSLVDRLKELRLWVSDKIVKATKSAKTDIRR